MTNGANGRNAALQKAPEVSDEGRGGTTSTSAPGSSWLKGLKGFVRNNPMSDRFTVHRFHHIEYWAADATNTYKRFQHGLGMTLVARSDQSTGNSVFASYVLQSNELVFAFTAPYSRKQAPISDTVVQPGYSQDAAFDFVQAHGLGVRAVGILVEDAWLAYSSSVANGAISVMPPTVLTDAATGTSQVVSEVKLYGDVVLRYISGDFKGPFLAGYTPETKLQPICYGIRRLDHAVGNVHNLQEAVQYVTGFTGFHDFAEFVAEDVGTLDSGLNSMVLASNNEMVLLPMNEPTFGTKRKSQIQTYLEQNEGPGLQHLALKTDDIFHTLREMRARSDFGGFEFMPRPSEGYYEKLPARIGTDVLTPEQYVQCKELGILVDRDDQGTLLQIFTKPLGDRPTVFVEIIQRLGCMREVPAKDDVAETAAAQHAAHPAQPTTPVTSAPPTSTSSPTSSASQVDTGAGAGAAVDAAIAPLAATAAAKQYEQAAGCGGFGKGNFSELFKSIEDYERTLNV